MSKIDDYKNAKAISTKLSRAVQCALGVDNKTNDKHRIYCKFTGLNKADWSDMQFYIHASHGYYGSSSGYSDSSEELGKYLAIAINEKKIALFERAAELAIADVEKAKNAAADEAKEVLEQTQLA